MAEANGSGPRRFGEVLKAELDVLRERRRWVFGARTGAPQADEPDAPPLDPPAEAPDGGAGPGEGRGEAGPTAAQAELDAQKEARLAALRMHLTGLALSGGGIRSATFALGVLQGLASLRLLSRFDYLSTVSGGGYIGGWYAAWLKREGDVLGVENELSASRIDQAEAGGGAGPSRRHYIGGRIVDDEPEPVHHLRSYSNYLTPRPGLLSLDTWTVLTIYARNSLINALFLLPLTMILVLLARWLVLGFSAPLAGWADGLENLVRWLALGSSGVSLLVAFVVMAWQVNNLQGSRRAAGAAEDLAPGAGPEGQRGISVLWFHALVVGPLVAAAVLCTWAFSAEPAGPPSPPAPPGPLRKVVMRLPNELGLIQLDSPSSLMGVLPAPLMRMIEQTDAWTNNTSEGWKAGGFMWISAVEFGTAFGAVCLLTHAAAIVLFFRRGARPGLGEAAYLVLCAVVAGFSGGFLLLAMISQVLWRLRDRPFDVVTFGPPLMLLVVVAGINIEVWLVNRRQSEDVREWWARLGAQLVIYGLAWLAFFGVVLYGPLVVHRFRDYYAGSGLTAGWLATTAWGAFAGRRHADARKGGSPVKSLLVQAAPPVFVVGLLVAVAYLVSAMIDEPREGLSLAALGAADRDRNAAWLYWRGVTSAPWWRVAFLLAGSGVAVSMAMAMTDVNLFSLNEMYADRLTRCYLGASRAKGHWRRRWVEGRLSAPVGAPTGAAVTAARRPNAVTGFDADDDIPLWAFKFDGGAGAGGGPTAGYDRATGARPYRGPYLLINTALNLVAGGELAWQDRKAESFVITPGFCGSQGTGYAETTRATERVLTLGRAMAISGAAVDSNIGVHQSSALIALMTVLNARLGWWMENPKSGAGWEASGPSVARPLLWELLGMTDAEKPFVHLSDGGHFENLAVYELVRRRCRYIVCCDAGTDPGASDDNIANMIRLCRTDFGVRIELDTAPLTGEGPDGLSRWHCVVGKIRYDDVDGGELPGVFVLLRATMTGDEPPDVQEYAAKNPEFPRESTLDQFFDEAQFESYRALGHHVASVAFGDPLGELEDSARLWTEDTVEMEFVRNNQRLFSAVQRRWSSAPTNQDEAFGSANRGWVAAQDALRTSRDLGPLSRDLYPEVSPEGVLLAAAPEGGAGETDGGGSGSDLVAPPGGDPAARGELHAVAQMLQVMEDAWVGLRLRGYRDLPMYRGWLSVFRRWTSTEAFYRYWPVLRVEYSQGFVRFCEDQLRLRVVTEVRPYEGPDPSADPEVVRLGREFEREWPRQPSLRQFIEWAHDPVNSSLPKPLWLITQAPFGPGGQADPAHRFACGVVTFYPVGALGRTRPEAPSPSGAGYELFVWIDRAYRSMSVGSRSAKQFIKVVTRRFIDPPGPGKVTFQVRYPAEGWTTADDLEFGLWRNFFTHYDFGPLPGEKLNRPTGRDVVLVKEFRGP